MNIKFTHRWLKELLQTSASAEEVAKDLNLCGPFEIENFEKIKNDWLYQIEVANNRPDAFSVFGIARECQAILPNFGFKTRYKKPQGTDLNLQPEVSKPLSLKVKIEKKGLCPRFTAIILDEIKIGSSPPKIVDRLNSAGIRAINNVVDVSNYLMLELGQPMHTFDFDKIKNAIMILRESRLGETIITLDSVRRSLPKGAIVIEDENRLIDLCGIMGGQLSQVDEKTKRVLLFVQTYDPQRIRKTTQVIGYRTEASSRFEKGIDAEGVLPAISRAVFLLKKYANAKIASELIDFYPNQYKPYSVSLTFKKLRSYLNEEISPQKVKKIFKSLDLKIQKANSSQVEVLIPSWRSPDLEIEEDLIEEVARIYGYRNIRGELPTGIPPKAKGEVKTFFWQEVIKDILKNWGFFYETYNYSLVSKSELKYFGEDKKAVKVRNPLGVEFEYLRPSLIPSLIKVFRQNLNLKTSLGFFELANVYQHKTRGLPVQKTRLTILINDVSFLKVKGLLEGLISILKIGNIQYLTKESPIYQDGLGFEIHQQKQILGSLGMLKIKILGDDLKIQPPFIIDLDLEKIIAKAHLFSRFKAIPRFPPVIEDLDLIVDQKITVGSIVDLIAKASQLLVTKVEIIDLYQNPKIGRGKKSVTLRLSYQSKTKTLTTKEISPVREKIKRQLVIKFNARIRDQTIQL